MNELTQEYDEWLDELDKEEEFWNNYRQMEKETQQNDRITGDTG